MGAPENPPAFPQSMAATPAGDVHWSGQAFPGADGMTLRDWFATHCPQWWLDINLPDDVGGMIRELLRRGMIREPDRTKPAYDAYTNADTTRLRIALCWDYADAMLAARKEPRP